jgi:hypothetical protein
MRPFGSTAIIQIREVSKRFKVRKKNVRTTSLAGQRDVLNIVELEHDISDQT